MALALTHLTSAGDDTNATDYTTASVSPAASSYVVIGIVGAVSGTPPTPTVTGFSATWTAVQSSAFDTAGTQRTLFVFGAPMSASPGSGTIGISFGATTMSGCTWSVLYVTGHNTTTPTRLPVQATGTGTSQSATLAALADAANVALAFVASDESVTFTGANAFTILGQATSPGGAPVQAVGSLWKLNATNPATTSTGTAGQLWGMVAVEIQVAPVAAGGFPTLATYVAWGYGPRDASPVWTLIPAGLVVEAHFQSCGRQLDTDQFQGGGGSITLNNNDGRFTPGNTASPYYPDVRFGTPIKQEATVGGNTYVVWRGIIEDTPVTFPNPPNQALCDWPIVDSFADLESEDAEYPWRQRIRASTPKVWLRFEEAIGSTQAIDSSGNAYHGAYVGGPTLEVEFGTGRGATFDGAAQYVTLPVDAAITGTGDFAIEFFGDITPSASGQTIYEQTTGTASIVFGIQGGTGRVQLNTTDAGGSTNLTGVADVSTGAEKHVIARRQGTTHEILVNGVVDATTTGTARSIPSAVPNVMNLVAVTSDELVTYQGTMAQATAQAHYQALNAYHGLTAGVQIGYILDSFGWPAADRDIDTGSELVLGQFDPSGSVLDMLRAAADADFGAFYVTPQGVLTFRARNSILVAPYTTVQGAFGNTGALLPVVIRTLKLDYQRRRIKNDITLRVNYRTTAAATAFTVETRKRDEASADAYGAQAWSKEVLTVAAGGAAATAARLGDLIDWTLAHYKDPIREVRQLELQPHEGSTTPFWVHALTRVQEDRISHAHTAPGGAVISGEYHIQRVSHDIGPGKQWRTQWTISPADTTAYWVWDTSTWDTGTRWAA